MLNKDMDLSYAGVQVVLNSGFSTPVLQDTTLESLQTYIDSLDSYEIVALETAATVSRSTAIGLSVLDGFIKIQDAVKYTRIEEDHQAMQYGKVDGAHDVEEANICMLLASSKLLVSLKKLV